MKHPLTRSQRRHNGEVWRERQRYIMKYCWFSSSRPNWFLDNNMWWQENRVSRMEVDALVIMKSIALKK